MIVAVEGKAYESRTWNVQDGRERIVGALAHVFRALEGRQERLRLNGAAGAGERTWLKEENSVAAD